MTDLNCVYIGISAFFIYFYSLHWSSRSVYAVSPTVSQPSFYKLTGLDFPNLKLIKQQNIYLSHICLCFHSSYSHVFQRKTKVCFDRTFTHGKITLMRFKICLDLRFLVVLCFCRCFFGLIFLFFLVGGFLIYIFLYLSADTTHYIYITSGPSTLSTNNSDAVSDGCFGFCIRVWNVLEIVLHQASSKQLVARWSEAYLSWQADGSKQKKSREKKNMYNSRFYWITSRSPLLGIEILSVSCSLLSVWACSALPQSPHAGQPVHTYSFFLVLFVFNHFLINLLFLSASFFTFISCSLFYFFHSLTLCSGKSLSASLLFSEQATQLDLHQSKMDN